MAGPPRVKAVREVSVKGSSSYPDPWAERLPRA
ncbi:hypothetical protein [Kitasatospora sp. NPDC059327]